MAVVNKDQEQYLHLSPFRVKEEKEVAVVVKKDQERDVQKNFL